MVVMVMRYPDELDRARSEAEAALPLGWYVTDVVKRSTVGSNRWTVGAAWEDCLPLVTGSGATLTAALKRLLRNIRMDGHT